MRESDPIVFVVDDEHSVRKALARLLGAEGFRVETFESAELLLESGMAGRADCLVVDLQLPGLTGLELQERLASEMIEVPIVFLTGHGDVPSGVRAMKVGAIDFLTKPVEDADLLAAVRTATHIGAGARERADELRSIRERAETLTPREREVMALVATGMLNKQIAYDLGTSEKTIKVHRAHVMEKMRVSSVAALVRLVDRLAEAKWSSEHGTSARRSA
jgi:FixJ family two-component response regulator